MSHSRWDDWLGELETSTEPEEQVEVRLARITRGGGDEVLELALERTTARLVYDDGEDGFRERAGDLAALIRCAGDQGATGRFYFLGTAGAEGDFAFELTLEGKRTKLRALSGAALEGVYESDAYRAFSERVTELLEARDPAFHKQMQKLRAGVPPSKKGASLHERVMAALASVSDARLAASARKFPMLVPDGKAPTRASEVFRSAGAVRALLRDAKSEELRAVALWVLGRENAAAALPLAREAVKASEPMRAAALRVLGQTRGDDLALDEVLRGLEKNVPVTVQLAALDAARVMEHPGLEAGLGELLLGYAKAPTVRPQFGLSTLLTLVETRKLRGLAKTLARFAISKQDVHARVAAAKCIIKWREVDAVKLLEPMLDEKYGLEVVAPAARRLLAKKT